MTAPMTPFAQIQLAEASYVLFDGMPYKDNEELRRRLMNEGADYKSDFSNAQADEFIKHWQVIGYQKDTPNGFSATLFENLDPEHPGQLTLAFRGTEPGWFGLPSYRDLVLADGADIVLDGLALDQIVDMYNYVQRLKAQANSTYTVARLETYEALSLALRNAYASPGSGATMGAQLEAQYAAQGYIIDRPTLKVRRVGFTLSSEADGLGLIGAGQTLTVTGHSLGGHLAMAYTRLFNDGAVAYTANAAGFKTNWNTENLLNGLKKGTGHLL